MLDVLVIGGGLAGLQAALKCKEAGLSVKVLEARDRVGGKSWSIPLKSKRGNTELGAAWINPYTQPRIGQYARQFNLHTVEQRVVGTAVLQTKSGVRFEHPFGTTAAVSENAFKHIVRPTYMTAQR
jgi:monoamine oxidase